MKLWMEFEEQKTREAYFGALLDRMQPLLLNYCSEGKSWQEHGISSSKVIARNSIFNDGPQILREYVFEMIKDAVEKGYLKK